MLVYGGAALFLFTIAGENTYTAFHGQWYGVLDWALICAVALTVTIIGAVQVRRLYTRLPR